MKKRYLLPLLILILSALPILFAQAGSNPLLVNTYGHGATVYTGSGGSKQAGLLYNGFSAELSLSSTNRLYSLYLTPDYTVWVNQETAQRRTDGVPLSTAWLAEVIQENAPLYTTPAEGHITARHAMGTLITVWGEFGDYYFVQDYNWMISGFFHKSSLRKIKDLSYHRAHSSDMGLDNIQEATIYTDGLPIYRCTSATGYSDNASYSFLQNGDTVKILTHLGNWVQLTDGGFIEARFLDPNGDHSSRYARVKSDQILDRLNVRTHANTDAWVEAKLCAGTRVRIISQTDEWAYIHVTGENGGASYCGCVKTEYLAMEGTEAVTNGSTRIQLKRNLYSGNDGWQYRAEWHGDTLPAGTLLTVIGVEGNYNASMEYPDRLLALSDEGKLICIWNDDAVEVVESAGISARTDSSLKMRQAPSKDGAVLRTLAKGTKVEVLLRGEGWTMIRYKDQTGYVMSRYLIFP